MTCWHGLNKICLDEFVCLSMTHWCVCPDSFMCVWYSTSERRTDHCVLSPWLVHVCVMTHSCVCDITHRQGTPITVWCLHDSFMRVPWLIHMCVVQHIGKAHRLCAVSTTHSYVCHDSSMCVCHIGKANRPLCAWRIHMCVLQHIGKTHQQLCAVSMTRSRVCRYSFICVWYSTSAKRTDHCVRPLFSSRTRGLARCGMTRDAFAFVSWLIHMCHMLFINKGARKVWHDSFVCVPWLIGICATTDSYMCHDVFIYVPCSAQTS